MQTHRSQMNVSECMHSSFEDIDAHHQQVTEGHDIEHLLVSSAGFGSIIRPRFSPHHENHLLIEQ